MKTALRKPALPAFRFSASAAVLLCATALASCATYKPPQISYDASVPPLPAVPKTASDDRPKPLHVPPAWTPAKGGDAATTSAGRIENANAAARIEPRREGYYNAIQIYPWSEGALYQVYTTPGKITDIALEPGEALTGAGPVAAGDTARWIIFRPFIMEIPASRPPFSSKAIMPPGWLICLFASSCCSKLSSPGKWTFETAGWPSSHSATFCADAQCLSMRRASVFKPRRISMALNGAITAPVMSFMPTRRISWIWSARPATRPATTSP